jgi:peptide/nickel transport system substrate-binding protein
MEATEVFRALNTGLIRSPYVADKASGEVKYDLYDYEPVLAEKFEYSPDNLTVTFTLKKDVVSVAGNPLTADDVIYSLERKYKNATSSAPATNVFLPDIDSQVAKIDDSTVSFTVTKPGYMTQLMFALTGSLGDVYDSTILKAHDTVEDPYALTWAMDSANANYGFGPYMLDSFTDGEEMVLVGNPNYPGTAPSVQKITYRVVPDAGTRTSALLAGDADVALQIRPADQASLADQGFGAYSYDFNDSVTVLDLVTTHAPFDDVKVRQALRYAIPYQQIIDNVYLGNATLPVGVLDSSADWWNGDGLETPEYDAKKSLALLKSAGITTPVEFSITLMSGIPDQSDAAIQIQSFAEDAGFKVNINEVPYADYYAGRAAYTNDALLEKFGLTSSAPTFGLTRWFRENARSNPTGWVNDEYLSLLDDEGGAIADPFTEEGGKVWNEAEQILQEETPLIWIARTQPGFVAAPGITGLVVTNGPVDYTQMKVPAT